MTSWPVGRKKEIFASRHYIKVFSCKHTANVYHQIHGNMVHGNKLCVIRKVLKSLSFILCFGEQTTETTRTFFIKNLKLFMIPFFIHKWEQIWITRTNIVYTHLLPKRSGCMVCTGPWNSVWLSFGETSFNHLPRKKEFNFWLSC